MQQLGTRPDVKVHLLCVGMASVWEERKMGNEEEGRGEKRKKDRVGNKDRREEDGVVVTHCSGNSSGQG